jgi:hypothetical protein
LLLNFSKIAKRELQIMRLQQLNAMDHRHIRFNTTGCDCSVEFYCNAHRTDWESKLE